MSDLDDTPNEEIILADVHSMSKDGKAELLTSVVGVISDMSVDLSRSISSASEEGESAKKCVEVPSVVATKNSNSDRVNLYAKELVTLGLLYKEFADGIREGDGNRVFRIWRYLLMILKTSNRTNYSIEVFFPPCPADLFAITTIGSSAVVVTIHKYKKWRRSQCSM